ncbi:MAG TPA: phage tail sheath subtilisin-like domain-containing protein [Blastocatellia bacterium]|nr:phage tail sheath subtilisin-like domain-containing protein [Blastocatellia bacterium]
MPEYLAPGVYVEETSFRSKSIEGVGTSTTGFVGPTLKGPYEGTPELVTNFSEFQRLYGGVDALQYGDKAVVNYLAHSVAAYFNEGGARLYIARVFQKDGDKDGHAQSDDLLAADAKELRFRARFPGAVGNGTATLRQLLSPATKKTLGRAPQGTMALIGKDTPVVHIKSGNDWVDKDGTKLKLDEVEDDAPPQEKAEVLTVLLTLTDRDGQVQEYEDLGLAPEHPRWIGNVLAKKPARRADALRNLYYLKTTGDPTGFDLYQAFFSTSATPAPTPINLDANDGVEPNAAAYQQALESFEKLEDIFIVAAPGATTLGEAQGIQNALISHAEKRRAYRIAVLDTPPETGLNDARDLRGKFDSTHAAMYYPWVVVPNPLARAGNEQIPREITLPPSGFVCGIYARNDANRGVFKAPANEVVRGALRFEADINFAQQEVLNPLGINCLRYLSGRGYRVWGARTVSSDPEWKYVNVRRYFNYLEASIDRGTQWAVFEPNGERLWTNIRETITSFLLSEWTTGALLGKTPEEAFFVRCDRSTMTQNDLDNGRLICLIGVAVVKPAEFVIFRIGQKTADSRN